MRSSRPTRWACATSTCRVSAGLLHTAVRGPRHPGRPGPAPRGRAIGKIPRRTLARGAAPDHDPAPRMASRQCPTIISTSSGCTPGGRSCPMPLDDLEAAARNVARRVAPRRDGKQGVVAAVDDQRRRHDPMQQRTPVPGREYRQQLPRGARRMDAAADDPPQVVPQQLAVHGEPGAADHAEHAHVVLDQYLGVADARGAREDRAQRARLAHADAQARVARRRHDGHEARACAADTSAATFCAIIPPIDTPTTWARTMPSASSRPTASAAMSSSVYGAVTGRRSSARAMAIRRSGRPSAGELARAAAVAVVEADHPETGGDEPVDDGVGPRDRPASRGP